MLLLSLYRWRNWTGAPRKSHFEKSSSQCGLGCKLVLCILPSESYQTVCCLPQFIRRHLPHWILVSSFIKWWWHYALCWFLCSFSKNIPMVLSTRPVNHGNSDKSGGSYFSQFYHYLLCTITLFKSTISHLVL